MAKVHPGPMRPYRVLDLTDRRGWLAGKVLADLGAEVIKVEPRGGDHGRWDGPFFKGRRDLEAGLPFCFRNRGKRSVTLDLEKKDGREIFRRLAVKADALLESFEPGVMEKWGLGYDVLSRLHPPLVYTAITAFGGEGPYASLKASDLTVFALSGDMYITGDPDRPPVRISVPQTFQHASMEGALYTAIALYDAARTGRGQKVDTSAHLAQMRAMMNATPYPPLEGKNLKRMGEYFEIGPHRLRTVFKAKDGYITLMLFGPGSTFPDLMSWAQEEVPLPEELEGVDWAAFSIMALFSDPGKLVLVEKACGYLAHFFPLHTKEELYEKAVEKRILLAPVRTTEDIRKDKQLEARGYFVEVDHGKDGMVAYAGPWAKLSLTPLVHTPCAPCLGEANSYVYGELLGLSPCEINSLSDLGVI